MVSVQCVCTVWFRGPTSDATVLFCAFVRCECDRGLACLGPCRVCGLEDNVPNVGKHFHDDFLWGVSLAYDEVVHVDLGRVVRLIWKRALLALGRVNGFVFDGLF